MRPPDPGLPRVNGHMNGQFDTAGFAVPTARMPLETVYSGMYIGEASMQTPRGFNDEGTELPQPSGRGGQQAPPASSQQSRHMRTSSLPNPNMTTSPTIHVNSNGGGPRSMQLPSQPLSQSGSRFQLKTSQGFGTLLPGPDGSPAILSARTSSPVVVSAGGAVVAGAGSSGGGSRRIGASQSAAANSLQLQPQLQISGKRQGARHMRTTSEEARASAGGAGHGDPFGSGKIPKGALSAAGGLAAPRGHGHSHSQLPDSHGAGVPGRLRGATTDANANYTAVPRMVQDTVTCIPLLKLLGRFSQGPRARPVSMIGKSLKDAMQKMQAPIKKGVDKIKVAGREMLTTFKLVGSDAATTSRLEEDGERLLIAGPTGVDSTPFKKRGSPEPTTPTPVKAPAPGGLLIAAERPGVPATSPLHGAARQASPSTARSLRPAAGEQLAVAGSGADERMLQDLRVVYVQVKHAHGLVKPQVQGLETGYATYCVIRAGSFRYKTQVLKGSAAPQWNEVFELSVPQLGACFTVQLEVWDVDAWGRDFFIGQAELQLEPLLLCSHPCPIDTSLPLVLLDPHTGQVEPGVYGHLSTVAWLGGDVSRQSTAEFGVDGVACALPGPHMGTEVMEDGFTVSSLTVRDGLPKGLPLVTHSSLGTLYEEPCVVHIKLSVVALRDINLHRLLQAALITNRTIKLIPRSTKRQSTVGPAGSEHTFATSTSKATTTTTTTTTSIFSSKRWSSSSSSWFRSSLKDPNMPVTRTSAFSNSNKLGPEGQGTLEHAETGGLGGPVSTTARASAPGVPSGRRRLRRRKQPSNARGGLGSESALSGSGRTKSDSSDGESNMGPGESRRMVRVKATSTMASGEVLDVLREEERGEEGEVEGNPGTAQDAISRHGTIATVTGVTVGLLTLPFKGAMFAGKLAYKGAKFAAVGLSQRRPPDAAAMRVGVRRGLLLRQQHGAGNNRRSTGDGGLEGAAGDGIDADEEEMMLMVDEVIAEGGEEEGEEEGEEDDGHGPEGITPSESGEVQGSTVGSSADMGPGVQDGPGTFYYFKASLGSQTFVSRMRWMPLNNPAEIRLPHSHFGFTVLRPIPDLTLTLTLFVTPTNKRKGRVAAQLRAPLASLLDVYAPGAVLSRDGAPAGLIQPFEDEDFGSAQLLVQLADADWRAALYKVPQMTSDMAAADTLAEPGGVAGAAACELHMRGAYGEAAALLHATGGMSRALAPSGAGSGGGALARGAVADATCNQPVMAYGYGLSQVPYPGPLPDTWSTGRLGAAGAGYDGSSQQQRQLQEVSMQQFVSSDPVVAAVMQARSSLVWLRTRALQLTSCSRCHTAPGPLALPHPSQPYPTCAPRGVTPNCTPSPLYTLAMQVTQRVKLKVMRAVGQRPDGDRPTRLSPYANLFDRGGNSPLAMSRALEAGGAAAAAALGRSAGTAFVPTAALAAGATSSMRPPVGEVRLRITTLRPRASSAITTASPVYALIRCGPHWVRTIDRYPSVLPATTQGGAAAAVAAGAGVGGSPQQPGTTAVGASGSASSGAAAFNWEVRLPLYDPSTLLSAAVVEVNTSVATLVGKAPEHTVVGKARMRLSTIDPFSPTPGWRTLTVFQQRQQQQDTAAAAPAPASATSGSNSSAIATVQIQEVAVAAGGGAAAAATQSQVAVAGAGGTACEMTRRFRHMAAGQGQDRGGPGAAQGAGSAGGADAADVLCVIQVQVRYPGMAVSSWQGSLRLYGVYLEAALPEPFYYLEMDDGDTWTMMQAEASSLARRWLSSVSPALPTNVSTAMVADGRAHFSLARAQHNFSRARAALRMFSDLHSWIKHIQGWDSPRDSCEVAFCIFLLCYYPSIAFKLFLFLMAGASWRQYCKRHGVCGTPSQGPGSRQQQQQQAELEEAADVPTNATTLQLLRQRYTRILEIALSAQNLFDDVATFFERLQAIMTWQDRAASSAFMLACIAAMLAIQLLGLSTVLCAGLMWQVRPPRLRDPIPPKPVSFFMRLPCHNDEAV